MKKTKLPHPEPSFSQMPPFDRTVAENEIIDASVEQYLDRVFTPLLGDVSADLMAERRLEMKAHIEELADTCAESMERPQAVKWALSQFGSPKSVTRAWQRELCGGHKPLSSKAKLAALTLFILAGSLWPAFGGRWPDIMRPLNLCMPLGIGILVGLTVRSRPVAWTAYTQATLLMPMIALNFGVLIWPKMVHEAQNQGLPIPSFFGAIITLAEALTIKTIVAGFLVVAIWWIGPACLGASIGRYARRLYIRQRLAIS